MSCYISSKENRFYAVIEQVYGTVAPVSENSRIPAVKLTIRQELESAERRDKTGGRTFAGVPSGVRKRTNFEMTTYMTSWTDQTALPTHSPLFLASLGGSGMIFEGGTVDSIVYPATLRFSAPHGLSVGQGISCGGEIRFVTAIVDAQTVLLNAPFGTSPPSGASVTKTVTYRPATDLSSVSIFDFWSPESSVQRVLAGAAIDRLRIRINGDFHEFSFSGPASDVLDSASFSGGQGGLAAFPTEPEVLGLSYSVIPGNLGQAWLGNTPDRFFTITSAEVTLNNDLDLRANEFGLDTPRCIGAGMRTVLADLSLYEQPDDATKALYQAARQRSPVSMMFQLGQQQTQLCGVYLKSVVPEVPEFEDDERRLQWRFRNCRAQGTIDDEIFVAFG